MGNVSEFLHTKIDTSNVICCEIPWHTDLWFDDLFSTAIKPNDKVQFSLIPCPDGYQMVLETWDHFEDSVVLWYTSKDFFRIDYIVPLSQEQMLFIDNLVDTEDPFKFMNWVLDRVDGIVTVH